VSALFVKGKASIDCVGRYFHLQIAASGLGRFGNDSEAELFKKVPTLEHLNALRQADDEAVVITLRGIAEMTPGKPDRFVSSSRPSLCPTGRTGVRGPFVENGGSSRPAGKAARRRRPGKSGRRWMSSPTGSR
jgi:hypothetical protein